MITEIQELRQAMLDHCHKEVIIDGYKFVLHAHPSEDFFMLYIIMPDDWTDWHCAATKGRRSTVLRQLNEFEKGLRKLVWMEHGSGHLGKNYDHPDATMGGRLINR